MKFQKHISSPTLNLLDIIANDLMQEFVNYSKITPMIEISHDLLELNLPVSFLEDKSNNKYPAITYAFGAQTIEQLIEGTQLFIKDFYTNQTKLNLVIWIRRPITLEECIQPNIKYRMITRLAVIPKQYIKEVIDYTTELKHEFSQN